MSVIGHARLLSSGRGCSQASFRRGKRRNETLSAKGYVSLMMAARYNMAAFRALLIGVLCLAIIVFPIAGTSSFAASQHPAESAVAAASGFYHHHGHSHDDDEISDGSPSHQERHAADHSHEIPGAADFMRFRIDGPTTSWRIEISGSGGPTRSSGIDRPPRRAFTI
ncbi:hypothetical protein [Allomesorhizobium camelthorni]|uniref:Uncharacterized protein n=1 Tax=Allomesorhizobium camelthorni TaxID=475069 RepID=A0A6G4WLW6_9HYPH|nr:hypothetical protein [Mesorhizobium camelthorni]NGO55067.1 hypothetical protein [Mesorhizobium camelthorni]